MTSENKNNRAKKKQPGTKRHSKVKDYGNDPFFIKKAEQSKAFLEKHGFPEELVSKK